MFTAIIPILCNINPCMLFLLSIEKKKNFKREIECTIRYKRIAENLKNAFTPAYLAFAAFVSQNFESLLLTFQRKSQ